MSPSAALVLTHLVATVTMFGVIWVVQLVHYPLFAAVGADGFPGYEAGHKRRITWIVFPAMALELATSLALLWVRPAAIPPSLLWVGAALVALLWVSTALVQVPLHTALSERFDPETHRRLVASNWVRTAAWSVRAGIAVWMAGLLMG